MRVVVTGASGYLGRYVTSLLTQEGADVVALSRDGEQGGFRCLIENSVGTLHDHLRGAVHVIHLAGRLVDDPHAGVTDYYEANVAFTDRVLRAAVDSDVKSFIHASSRLVYPGTLTAPAVEDQDCFPDTPYGISKRWAEDLVHHYAAAHGLSSLSLRVAQVTGGEHPGLGVINGFISQARNTHRITVHGGGGAVREFVHVEDVARAFVAALDHRGSWMPINVGGVRALTVLEIAQKVAEMSPEDVEIHHLPVDREDNSCYALDQDRAHRTLRWRPLWSPDEIIAAAFTR